MRNRTIFVALSFLVAASTFAAAADDAYTTWQLDFRDVPVTVAQDVIDRTLGSGSIDLVAGQELLERLKGLPMQTATRDWFDQHPDAAVYGGVPFYGPRNLPVATEYYMQCGDNICGAIYDVFPTATTTDEAMDLIRRGSHCLDAYYCDTGSNPGSFSLKTFLVPWAVPVSLRLARSIPDGRMKFYHGIYAVRASNRQVFSLDPRDAWLTRQQLKLRLLGLADFSMRSPSIPLILERARTRTSWASSDESGSLEKSRQSETAYPCQRVEPSEPTTRVIQVSHWDGTFHEETVSSTSHPSGSYYAPDCVGIPLIWPMLFGSTSFLGSADYLTGRVSVSSFNELATWLDGPFL